MKEKPNNVKWVVKFVQKWNLTLLPIIMHGRVVVNCISSHQNKYRKITPISSGFSLPLEVISVGVI